MCLHARFIRFTETSEALKMFHCYKCPRKLLKIAFKSPHKSIREEEILLKNFIVKFMQSKKFQDCYKIPWIFGRELNICRNLHHLSTSFASSFPRLKTRLWKRQERRGWDCKIRYAPAYHSPPSLPTIQRRLALFLQYVY